MRGCFRYFLLMVFALIVAAVVSVVVVLLSNQGLLPWLNTGFRNQATVVLTSVQQMSVLTTTRYNFSTMVTSEREMPPLLAGLYGERQVLVAVGTVTAGIDLSRMSRDDVWIEGQTVNLRLPPPVLQDCFLDENASYVAQRDTGLFARNAPELEGQARQYAIQQFRQAALDQDIFENVQQQAATAITQFVDVLDIPGVNTINVITTPMDPASPLPPSCL